MVDISPNCRIGEDGLNCEPCEQGASTATVDLSNDIAADEDEDVKKKTREKKRKKRKKKKKEQPRCPPGSPAGDGRISHSSNGRACRKDKGEEEGQSGKER